MSKPVLSIGIIFKNEIRCLERCLKSLQSLREAVPCELVMADTGSDDGSREIAEKYADILFDFPWINDFSAARNAVMDRSAGCGRVAGRGCLRSGQFPYHRPLQGLGCLRFD